MRWQFEVEERADENVAGRIVWTVDYEKNGLSRNSYFPPQDSRISAKITVLGEHPESIVTVFKVRHFLYPGQSRIYVYCYFGGDRVGGGGGGEWGGGCDRQKCAYADTH